jgi:hypothetical protein
MGESLLTLHQATFLLDRSFHTLSEPMEHRVEMLGKPVQKSGKVTSSKKIEMGGYKINPSKDGSRITI